MIIKFTFLGSVLKASLNCNETVSIYVWKVSSPGRLWVAAEFWIGKNEKNKKHFSPSFLLRINIAIKKCRTFVKRPISDALYGAESKAIHIFHSRGARSYSRYKVFVRWKYWGQKSYGKAHSISLLLLPFFGSTNTHSEWRFMNAMESI